MIGTDGDLVSSIELGDYVILEADVCSQPYASFLGRAFRQYHSDGLCTYLVTGRHVSPEKGGQHEQLPSLSQP